MPFQTGRGAPSTPCRMGTRAVIPGVRQPCRGERPPQSTVKFRMSTVTFLLTLCAFLARYGETFTFNIIISDCIKGKGLPVPPADAQ